MTPEEREKLVESAKTLPRVEVPLRFPVEHMGREIKKLSLRRPTVGDVIDAGGSRVSPDKLQMTLIQLIGEISPDAIRAIDLSDYDLLTDVLAAFQS